MRRLIICDPGLLDIHGHHYDFNIALASAARKSKLEIAFLTNTQFTDPIGEVRPIGIFSHSIYEPSPEFAVPADTVASGPVISTFAEELALGLDLLGATNDDVVFIHTADLVLIWSLFDFFLVRDEQHTPTVAALIRYEKSPNGIPYPEWLPYAIRNRYVNSGVIGERFFLYGETEGLSHWLTRVTGLAAEWLPHVSQREEPPSVEDKQSDEALTVVYAGEARIEKGFEQLPLILDQVSRRPDLADRLKFRIQADAGKAGVWDADVIKAARDKLKPHEISGLAEIMPRLDDEEFFALLSRAHVLLLPYKPASYKFRGSGIFAEAELLGIPIVVRQDTSMANELRPGSGIEFADIEGAVEALSRIASDYPAWRKAAVSNGLDARQLRSMSGLMTRLAELTKRRAGAPRAFARVALHVAPLWSGQGGSYVFQAQIDYLRDRGFVVFCVNLKTWDEPPQPSNFIHQRLADQSVGLGAAYQWCLGRPDGKRALEERRGVSTTLSIAEERKWALDAALPSSLLRALSVHEPNVVIINYSHNIPLVERLGVQNIPVIVETLDIRTNQYLLTAKTALDASAEYEKEWRHTARGDAVVFINVGELNTFLNASGYKKPAMAVTPVVTQSRPRRMSCDLALELMKHDSGIAFDAKDRKPIVLFVGSSHLANILSFDWFYSEVFAPYLQREDLSLVVAGNIGRHYADYDLPGVTFLGHVPELDCIYEIATVVVLPIVAGTGQPIKAIDAIRMRKPLVATSKAFAGTPDLASYFQSYDAPKDFAEAVLELIASPQSRERLLKQIDSAHKRVLEREVYQAAWDRLFTSLSINVAERGPKVPDLDLTDAYARGAISSPIKVDSRSPKLTVRDINAGRYVALDFVHEPDETIADLTLTSARPFDAVLKLNGAMTGKRSFSAGRNLLLLPVSAAVSSIEFTVLNGVDIDVMIETGPGSNSPLSSAF